MRRGDPEKFTAVMAAPVVARPTLFVLFAFNLEVARAPWVTSQEAIAEIRLQWWHDCLQEIETKSKARSHEVVKPLSKILSQEAARDLKGLVEARRWDIYKKPFNSEAHFKDYILKTSSNLLWVAAQTLGVADKKVVEEFGYGVGLANFFVATPDLLKRGRLPLLRYENEFIRSLAEDGILKIRAARLQRAKVSSHAGAALLSGWKALRVLKQVARYPNRVRNGLKKDIKTIENISLIFRSLTGQW